MPTGSRRSFPQRVHDFGNVARGSQVRHAFPVVNRTQFRSAHRQLDAPSAAAPTSRSAHALIPPGTQTTIEATIDTTRFQGHKDSGLTLVLDRPSLVSVELNMTCFIRGDITLTPGQFDFGTVRRSDKLPSTTLTLTYAGGRPDWEIAEMKTQSAKVKAVAERVNRSASGLIQWTVTATLQPSDRQRIFQG